MIEDFPQINVRHQPTHPGTSENTKQNKCQKTKPRHIIFKLQKIRDKEKILKETSRKKKEYIIKLKELVIEQTKGKI